MEARIFTTQKSLFLAFLVNRVLFTPRTIPLVFKFPFHGLAILMRRVVCVLTICTSQSYDIVAEFSLSHVYMNYE